MDQLGLMFESLDQLRRWQGNALDAIGLGPRESAYRTVFSAPCVSLRHYGAAPTGKPVLLIVPAPIKRPYIWDLAPERSVVRRAVEHGFDVYMTEWTEPSAQESSLGLADYAGPMMDRCMDAIAGTCGADKVFLASHSLGGVLAALYSAYRPDRVAALVLVDAPLHFAEAAGAFTRLLELHVPAEAVLSSSARIPGSTLSMIGASAAPAEFGLNRYLDYIACLGSRELMETHCRVERWTMDEVSMPRKLFDDVVEQLYRQDRFMRGLLTIGARRLRPSDVTAPLFSTYEPNSSVIPAESVLAFQRAAGSSEKELMPYLGDAGVALQHVGGLVGDNAHREIWPRAFAWLERIGLRDDSVRTRRPDQPLSTDSMRPT